MKERASVGRKRKASVRGEPAFRLGRPKGERALGRRSREFRGASCLRVDFAASGGAQGRFQGLSVCKSLSLGEIGEEQVGATGVRDTGIVGGSRGQGGRCADLGRAGREGDPCRTPGTPVSEE